MTWLLARYSVPVAGWLVRALGSGCTNMMVYVCERDDHPREVVPRGETPMKLLAAVLIGFATFSVCETVAMLSGLALPREQVRLFSEFYVPDQSSDR